MSRQSGGRHRIATMSRRNWLYGTMAGTAPWFRNAMAENVGSVPASGRLKITLACWDYDRTSALANRSIQPDGIDLNWLSLSPEETFFRMLRYHEFEAAEMSLSSYVVSLFQEDPQFVAIPVFPSRMFRHSCIFVSTRSRIREPRDLIGKRVGNPEYQMTAVVWIRGIFSDEYGVAPSAVEYWTGGEEQPGREEKIRLELPPEFKVKPIGANQTLSQMLADGELDALYTARIPSTYLTRPKDVKRLFENYGESERAYYRKTRIFPIMHTVVIRRDIYRSNPWVAQSLTKAFVEAQKRLYEDLHQTAVSKFMLPWLQSQIDEVTREMGQDWWPYGFSPNRHVLETFLRYHYEQGLSKRKLQPDELFAPETLESYKL
jgi:4,5-dihydroxyphthalate decarboxylase